MQFARAFPFARIISLLPAAAEVGPGSAVAASDEEEGLSRLRLLVDSGPDGPAAPGATRSVLSSDVYAFIPTADPAAAAAAGSRSQPAEEDSDQSSPAHPAGQSRSAAAAHAAAPRIGGGSSGPEPVGAEEAARVVSDLIRRLGVPPLFSFPNQHFAKLSCTPLPPYPFPASSSTLRLRLVPVFCQKIQRYSVLN